jgi:PAS domain S-box-containing protein
MNLPRSRVSEEATSLPAVLRRHRLVWKVNAVFLAILVCVIGISGYVANTGYERSALESAREVSRVNAEVILGSLRELMLRREGPHVGDLITRVATDNAVYHDIRLIAHDGTVRASRFGTSSNPVEAATWPCNSCHGVDDDRRDARSNGYDEIVELPDGGRVVSVATPILAEPSCIEGDCHADPTSPPVLGILQSDFSLARVDDLMAQHNSRLVFVLLASILLGTAATWWTTDRLIGRRIRALREGARRIAERDLNFRFSDPNMDAIAQVENVLDDMTSEFSSTLSELVSTKEHLQGIVESSGDIIITVDPSGLIRTFNQGAERILGYSRGEVKRDAAIEQLKHSDQVVNYLTHFLTKDGEVRNVILTLSRLRGPDGTPIGTFGISKDVTKELRLQRQLVQSERMAALGQAVTGIQHSIKNLLNVLKGGSYMVKLGLAKDDKDILGDGWKMVEDAISHMTDMSKGMLDFARDRKLDISPTDLGQLAQKVRALSEARFREDGIALELDVSPDLPLVECDGEMIHSVVMDLLSNAHYACSWKEYEDGERPFVAISVHRAELDGFVDIQVSDNGEGMSEDVRGKIFTPFFSTKKQAGTGMGLAVVARIVSSHGGSTTVESEPGKGTTFHVLLPIDGSSVREE